MPSSTKAPSPACAHPATAARRTADASSSPIKTTNYVASPGKDEARWCCFFLVSGDEGQRNLCAVGNSLLVGGRSPRSTKVIRQIHLGACKIAFNGCALRLGCAVP